MTTREEMAFDVVIVGAGPAGLAAACRLGQLAQEAGSALSICVVEKGAEVGAHILSGAVFDPRALDELFPEWRQGDAPVKQAVTDDHYFWLASDKAKARLPAWMVPKPLHNQGHFIISLGRLCQWLAQQAESLGVEIYPGFAASELVIDDEGRVCGIQMGDLGLDKQGAPKAGYTPGMILRGKYTLLAEGSRGHLGKQAIQRYQLDSDCSPQHYALGFKELWQVSTDKQRPGTTLHTLGWPLDQRTGGGGYLYHQSDGTVSLGLVVDLNYQNPWLSPFEEFQRFKTHPLVASLLEGGERLAYGARAITKGGLFSLPKMVFPGGLLLGCDAGSLDPARLKGSHMAMKTGLLAAEALWPALEQPQPPRELTTFTELFEQSWAYQDLVRSRNFLGAQHKFGLWAGGALNWLEHNVLAGRVPWQFRDNQPDHASLQPASQCEQPPYPGPDRQVSFDKPSSVFLSGTNHDEDQPCHLQLIDPELPVRDNLPRYAEPAQRYCPAGVYEMVDEGSGPRLQINASNCLHCKACDIKDPAQNIRWVPPEGGGGPNYQGMM